MTQELIVPVDDLSTVLLPEDHELAPCEDCSAVARWSLKCPGCTHLVMVCTKHRAEVDDHFERCRAVAAECIACKAEVPIPLPWLPL